LRAPKFIRRAPCDYWSDSRQGGSDVGARIIANRLSEVWGQQVVVENKPGAGGHLAIEVAAHANPDGYTIIWVGGSIPLYGLMIKSINYDPEADLTPVTLVGTYPNLLAVPNFSPWKSERGWHGA
jgi:tripartite-type tricarboxylate transporter receptor subunit TctC